ncbi:hypothetical protein [Shewanella baltica]|uniref:hypothetical protein n=1 Tax=Shewanella baltica TaxID=62322 RepID=UPI00217D9A87|nr:hypothetical protein [Shewanella baltica]
MNLKNKTLKVKKTHELVSSVLSPKKFVGGKESARSQAFCNFIGLSSDGDFERAIGIILRDTETFSSLNQSKIEVKDIFRKWHISPEGIKPERFIKWYKSILLKKIDELAIFLRNQEKIEDLFIKGDYVSVSDCLEVLKSYCGDSIWSINVQFAIYTANKDYAKIDSFLEELKSQNDTFWLHDIVRVTGWKSQAVDAELIVESMVRRMNKEFIAGGANDFAAYYALTCLHFPLYDDIDLSHAISWSQRFPLVDLFEALIKISQHGILTKSLGNELKVELISLFEALNERLVSNKLNKIIFGLKGEVFNAPLPCGDKQIIAYNEGRYCDVINSLEKDFMSITNMVTKINIFAKSYIHLNREPDALPDFLSEIIRNLIYIYSLRDANQSISRLINLVIKYSSMELSDHLMVSIAKSAPFYFPSMQKSQIIGKSKLLTCPLTPLAYNLDLSPSLYLNDIGIEVAPHILVKKQAIAKMSIGDDSSGMLVDEFYNISPIKKDAIELKAEYYVSRSDNIGLITYAAEELISNKNSNVCLPLDKIISYIDSEHVYSVDSVICSYFHNLFSKEDNSSILNEVFEEYVISLGVSRPSELINSSLSLKELFVLKEVSKVEVMDYLGCFEDENDLKIERINLLNRLVDCKYLRQKDIDKECKYIVDDILIENEAAKFNDSKIFVDTKHIFNKKKSDIESLLIQYYSDLQLGEVQDTGEYEIESMTVLKGSRNEIITRLINLLLVEYMNNQEVGLDANLSSEIRHGFFSNLMCSKLQHRHLITEINEDGDYKSNSYWMDYYRMVNKDIMSDIDNILIKFSDDFNSLIECAEQWMKTSLNNEDALARVFVFQFTIEDFENLRNEIDSNYSNDVEIISEFIFQTFNSKLSTCLDIIKHKLNEVFAVKIDELFSMLIDDINEHKSGTSLRDLLEEIKLANTEVKEDVRTVCEWFSFKKSTEFESFEVKKSIKLAEKCFKQINNCDIDILINSETDNMVEGKHLYAIVFAMINCFNNCYKYACGNKRISVNVSGFCNSGFSISITNQIDSNTVLMLNNGRLLSLINKLSDMDDNKLLTNEGGSGLYKSLHGLRMVSTGYNVVPSLNGNDFCVEVTYEN